MLRSWLKLDRFNKVLLERRFYLIEFVAPEGEFLAFNSLCRLGWSFSGNPAWAAEMLGLATQPTAAFSGGAGRDKRDETTHA
ncbi:hypothetical protein [Methylobacter sp. sgz302048]|uniref:hypothetical protein n=1 Tax=Methylobacter sp. sgz302048 TaxID=3455945 RepID=UPI003FA0F4D2